MALTKCPECSREVSSQAGSCPHCGFPLAATPKAIEPQKLEPGDIICPNPHCGYIGPPKKEARGSMIVAILLFFLFVLPGLIYMVVMSRYNYVCPRCGVHIRGGPA